MGDVVIVDSVRTGLAKAFRGSFNMTRSDDMLAHCIDSLLDRNSQVAADEVEDVVVGAASHAGEQDGNLARLAVVLSKLPITTAGVTINRFCSSGLQSIAIAANQTAADDAGCYVGGVDSISMRTRQEPGKAQQNQRLVDENLTFSWRWVTRLRLLRVDIRLLVRCRTNTFTESAAVCGRRKLERLLKKSFLCRRQC